MAFAGTDPAQTLLEGVHGDDDKEMDEGQGKDQGLSASGYRLPWSMQQRVGLVGGNMVGRVKSSKQGFWVMLAGGG